MRERRAATALQHETTNLKVLQGILTTDGSLGRSFCPEGGGGKKKKKKKSRRVMATGSALCCAPHESKRTRWGKRAEGRKGKERGGELKNEKFARSLLLLPLLGRLFRNTETGNITGRGPNMGFLGVLSAQVTAWLGGKRHIRWGRRGTRMSGEGGGSLLSDCGESRIARNRRIKRGGGRTHRCGEGRGSLQFARHI